MKFSKTHRAVIALIIANTIWGAAAPIFKWSLASIPPFTLAFLRFGIAAAILLPFSYKHLAIKPKHIIPVVLVAVLGISINISFFFLGLTRTSSINAPIIASSGPIFLIFLALFFLKEKVTRKELYGGLLGLLGVIFIVMTPVLEKGLDGSVTGNLFFVIAMAGSVLSVLILKKIARYYRAETLTFWQFALGAVSFIPFFMREVDSVGFLPKLDTPAVSGILFGAFLSSALAYYLNNWAIKYMPVGEVGIFTYIDPVIAVLIAVPLLGEYPTTPFFIGSFLVFLGIYIAEGRLHYHPFHKLFK